MTSCTLTAAGCLRSLREPGSGYLVRARRGGIRNPTDQLGRPPSVGRSLLVRGARDSRPHCLPPVTLPSPGLPVRIPSESPPPSARLPCPSTGYPACLRLPCRPGGVTVPVPHGAPAPPRASPSVLPGFPCLPAVTLPSPPVTLPFPRLPCPSGLVTPPRYPAVPPVTLPSHPVTLPSPPVTLPSPRLPCPAGVVTKPLNGLPPRCPACPRLPCRPCGLPCPSRMPPAPLPGLAHPSRPVFPACPRVTLPPRGYPTRRAVGPAARTLGGPAHPLLWLPAAPQPAPPSQPSSHGAKDPLRPLGLRRRAAAGPHRSAVAHVDRGRIRCANNPRSVTRARATASCPQDM